MRRFHILILLTTLLLAAPAGARADLEGDWGFVLEPLGGGNVSIAGVATDASGNIHIVGNFTGTFRLVGGPSYTSSPSSTSDVFVMKFTSTGTHLWTAVGGGSGNDYASDIAVSPAGLVGITGFTTSSTFSFAGGAAITNSGQYDAFAVSLNSAGVHNFSRLLGGAFTDRGQDVAFNSNNEMFITGIFRDQVNFGTGVITSNGLNDFFLVRFTLWGATGAAVGFGGTGNEELARIDVNGPGNIAFAGQFNNTVNVGNGPLVSSGGGDVLLARFPSVGAAADWSYGFGASGFDAPGDVCFDGDDSVFLSGSFSGTVNFGFGNFASAGATDGFVGVYKSDGSPIWGRRFGGTQGDFMNDVLAEDGRIFVGGEFGGTVTFGSDTYTAVGTADAILLEFDYGGDWVCTAHGRGSQYNSAADLAYSGQPILITGFFTNMSWGGFGIGAPLGGFGSCVVKMKVASSVSVPESDSRLRGPVLGPAMPNPLRAGSRVSFALSGDVAAGSARIVDVLGRVVRDLGFVSGAEGISWDGRDEGGRGVPSGVYFLKVAAGTRELSERVIVTR